MSFQTLLVTVGTTSFDSLIDSVLSFEFLDCLVQQGFTHVDLQYGSGSLNEALLEKKYGKRLDMYSDRLCITPFSLKPSLQENINRADLIVGHAGAGTALEVLRAHKRFIMVVNEELMNNHQRELAEKLEKLNCVMRATPNTLVDCLHRMKNWNPTPFPTPRLDLFDTEMRQTCGLSVLD